MKTLEFIAQYKIGHTFVQLRTTIGVKNVVHIQELKEEIPEFFDGAKSMVTIFNGERVSSTEKYTELSERYNEAMKEEEL